MVNGDGDKSQSSGGDHRGDRGPHMGRPGDLLEHLRTPLQARKASSSASMIRASSRVIDAGLRGGMAAPQLIDVIGGFIASPTWYGCRVEL